MTTLLEDNFIKTNGIQLHYVTAGKGPLVLFLHGFPECWYSWRYQLHALASKFRVVAPDLRGYNKSDKPKGIKSYELSILVEDIYGIIKGLGERRATIVAHDWGAGIAWQLAMERPDVVESLIVMNAAHPAIYLQQIRRNLKQLRKSWYILFYQLPWLPEICWSFKNAKTLAMVIRKYAIQQDNITESDLEYLCKAASQPGVLNCAINYYRALMWEQRNLQWSKHTLEDWPKIKAPTLLLWGMDDAFLVNELTIGMEPLFTNSLHIELIPNCGHWIQQEVPEVVNIHLQKFLSNVYNSYND